ncbi:hypothetical protein [Haloarcula sp. 1CSR25-25]|uniref:hypothetical protein n=1 Tax=Haloarcula sp. 1CSR25-25 TaxID=2862545 RepID=UPI0028949509|nr:hypothetical protein [Haloarcula sp. 1CSR25-25]MDT3437790.1 hypothetical protein [Haloarcula sp. 1CSR25-25]
MPNETSDQDGQDSTEPLISRTDYMLLKAMAVVGVATLFMGTAAAQSDPICGEGQASVISSTINTIIQLATYGGIIGTALTFFGTSAIESAPVGDERREKMKSVRKKSFSASTKLVFGGPLLYIIITQSGLPWGECITLVPF